MIGDRLAATNLVTLLIISRAPSRSTLAKPG
jgi:hypothetical protein